ncbi:MAG: 3'-5' exonuclease [Chlamydiae bacterium]|nr:3'-5' exonuclease [Chlamydiota bacterium]
MLGIFLDTETSGLDPKKHKILELAFKIICLTTGQTLETFSQLIAIDSSDWQQSDKTSLQINGLSWDTLQQGKPLGEVQKLVHAIFKKWQLVRGKAVFICQNPSFDRSFFSQIMDIPMQESLLIPYHWLDLASMYWGYAMAQHLTPPWETGFTKDKIAARFHIPSEALPHRALHGVDHLLKCYEAMLGFPKKPS